jgi:hypothetical protein
MSQSTRLIAALLPFLFWPLIAGAAEPASPQPGPPPAPPKQPAPPAEPSWLGVQLAPVPRALASHLKLDEIGVMVRNIFKDSPADKAGLERYDVIVGVDGKPMNEGVEVFSQFIHDRKPGDVVELSLYRAGAKQAVRITLGNPPTNVNETPMKYEDDPDVAQRRLFGLRGKILRPGPHGWILDDLGEMPPLPEFKEWMKSHPGQTEPMERSELEGRRVDADGNVLQVHRNPDGSIEVRRYKNGTPAEQTEVKKYENIDQLRHADADAAKLLDELAKDTDAREPMSQRWNEAMKEHGRTLREYEDSLREYEDAVRDYIKRHQHQWEHRLPGPDSPQWQEWNRRFFQTPPAPPAAPKAEPQRPGMEPGNKPAPSAQQNRVTPTPPSAKGQTSFEVHPDGSITAEVNDGATRLTMTFPNEGAFKQQAPNLYERYKTTLDRAK